MAYTFGYRYSITYNKMYFLFYVLMDVNINNIRSNESVQYISILHSKGHDSTTEGHRGNFGNPRMVLSLLWDTKGHNTKPSGFPVGKKTTTFFCQWLYPLCKHARARPPALIHTHTRHTLTAPPPPTHTHTRTHAHTDSYTQTHTLIPPPPPLPRHTHTQTHTLTTLRLK